MVSMALKAQSSFKLFALKHSTRTRLKIPSTWLLWRPCALWGQHCAGSKILAMTSKPTGPYFAVRCWQGFQRQMPIKEVTVSIVISIYELYLLTLDFPKKPFPNLLPLLVVIPKSAKDSSAVSGNTPSRRVNPEMMSGWPTTPRVAWPKTP